LPLERYQYILFFKKSQLFFGKFRFSVSSRRGHAGIIGIGQSKKSLRFFSVTPAG